MSFIKTGTAHNIIFVLVSATDNQTEITGVSPSCSISKNGGAYESCDNTPVSIGNGTYALTLTAAETDTSGPLIVRSTYSGAATSRREYQVGGLENYFGAPTSATLSQTERNDLADSFWRRDLAETAAASGPDALGRYTGLTLAMSNVGVVESSGEQITVKGPDGTTTLAIWSVVTSDAADLTVSRT